MALDINSIVGNTYNNLLVLSVYKQNKRSYVHCKCLLCGKEIDSRADAVTRGIKKNCGCKYTHYPKIQINDHIHELTVLGRSIVKSGYWTCQCSCGNIKDIKDDVLKNGNTISCGCMNIRSKAAYREDITGQVFGRLIAIRCTDEISCNRSYIWECLCECGSITYVPIDLLKKGNTRSCGCLGSKGEVKIIELLNKYNIAYSTQKSFKDFSYSASKDSHPKFDFYINNQYLIEYDGSIHFQYGKSGWYNKENYMQIKQRDEIKNQYCLSHGIPLIRIPYTHYDDLCVEDLLLETTTFRVV